MDPNTLAPGIWPESAHRASDGALVIAGVHADHLAAKFGTPLYVIDRDEACARAKFIREAASTAAEKYNIKFHVYYAGKAFLCSAVARWMHDAGLRIDVCSAAELTLVLAAKVHPANVGFHGNNKSLNEIDRAVRVGVGSIIIDHGDEVDAIVAAARRYGKVQPVRVRVKSGVHASTHDYLSTGFEDQKFGVDFETAWEIVDKIRQYRELCFLGLHGHIGSQIFDASGFKVAARRLVELHAKLCDRGPIPELNLGGGFGIAYVTTDEVQPMNEILSDLVDTVAETCAGLHVPVPDLVIEPGRWIIGPAGITLYTVGVVKDVMVNLPVGTTRRYISIDGGMSDNLRPALYGARYTSCVANRFSDSTLVLVRIVGKHCEAGDIVVDADWLPEETSSGDLIAVAATGAYCHSLSSNYNMLPRPAVVAVQDHGAHVIVRGETEEDVVRRDPGCQAFIGMGGARSFYDRDCWD